MPKSQIHIAIDLGASSGRIMAGRWFDDEIELIEVHRFASSNLYLPPYRHWDVLHIFSDILDGLRKAVDQYGDRIVSIGVDTWGVDYGYLDQAGELLANPVQYRDSRTDDSFAAVTKELGQKRIYAETGIQFLPFNTIYQLAADKQRGRGAFYQAERFLFMPDLINYWLTGIKIQERTIASTSQLLNPITGNWSKELLEPLGLPERFFGPVTEPGTVLGPVRPDLADDLGLGKVEVVAVPGHDTASAVAATPFSSPKSVFLSSGTWSIMGREMEEPNVSEAAREAGFSNEIGLGGTVRFLKNICGMWLIEESRRVWAREGEEYSYAAIVELARKAPARRSLIDPDAAELSTPGDMPARIGDLCRRTGEPEPTNPGEILRTAFDSLVMKYRYTFQILEELGDGPYEAVHIVGGGAQNDFLNQMAADAIGVPVHAGPSEATSLGNIVTQMIARQTLPDIGAAREVIARSFPTKSFFPEDTETWALEDARYRKLLS